METMLNVERGFFNLNPIPMIVMESESGRIINANIAAVRFYGYDIETFRSLNIRQINQATQLEIDNEMKNATLENRNFFVFHHKLASGVVKSVEVISTPISIEGKTYLYSMISDLTSKHSLTAHLMSSNHDLIDILKIKNETLIEETMLHNSLLENLNVAFISFNIEGRYLSSNHAFQSTFYDALEVSQISLSDFKENLRDRMDLEVINVDISQNSKHDSIKDAPIALTIGGELKYYLLSITSFGNKEALTYGCTFLFKDITRYMVSEIKKREVESKFRKIFDYSPAGLVSVDKFGVVNECNEAFIRMIGSTFDKMIGLDLTRLPDHDFRAGVLRCISGKNASYEGWYTPVTGCKKVYMSAVFTTLFDANQIIGGLIVISDVTAIKESEIFMEAQKNQFEALFRNSPIATVQFDLNHHVHNINNAFTELFEYTSDMALGCELDSLLSNDTNIYEMKKYTDDTFKGIAVRTSGVRISMSGKEIPVDIIVIPIKQKGKVIGGYTLYTDMREANRIKQELLEAKYHAEAANQAKTRFLANMSHEIRTPMNGFIGLLSVLESTELNDLQKKYVTLANTSANSLLMIVSDILDYSKIDSHKMKLKKEQFDLHRLLDEMIALFQPLALQKDLALSYDLDCVLDQWWVGDALRIKQVLSNLIGNAIKYTEIGKVEIRVSLFEERLNDLCILKFQVSDTGIGIPEDKKDYLFTRFSQLHDENAKHYGGTGLGLAISKGIVELMNGEILLEHSSVHGSVFSFTCELDRICKCSFVEEAEKTISKGITNPTEVKQSKNVLIADDDEVSRFIFEQLATGSGWEVSSASNGLEAVKKCETMAFDVILMDCQMPIMSGYEAAQIIREQCGLNAGAPIIALTAFSQEQDEQKCMEAGMTHYFSKPVNYSDLMALILTL